MSIFDRDKIAKTAKSIADHAMLVDHVKALQDGQKEIAASLVTVNNRLANIEAEFRVLKAEAQRDALREVQSAVNAVQGAFFEKLGELSTRMSILEREQDKPTKNGNPIIALTGRKDSHSSPDKPEHLE